MKKWLKALYQAMDLKNDFYYKDLEEGMTIVFDIYGNSIKVPTQIRYDMDYIVKEKGNIREIFRKHKIGNFYWRMR